MRLGVRADKVIVRHRPLQPAKDAVAGSTVCQARGGGIEGSGPPVDECGLGVNPHDTGHWRVGQPATYGPEPARGRWALNAAHCCGP